MLLPSPEARQWPDLVERDFFPVMCVPGILFSNQNALSGLTVAMRSNRSGGLDMERHSMIAQPTSIAPQSASTTIIGAFRPPQVRLELTIVYTISVISHRFPPHDMLLPPGLWNRIHSRSSLLPWEAQRSKRAVWNVRNRWRRVRPRLRWLWPRDRGSGSRCDVGVCEHLIHPLCTRLAFGM